VNQLGGIKPAAPKPAPEKQEEVGSFGD